MLKDGIPKHLETEFETKFKMEERYDKINDIKIGRTMSYLLRHDPEDLVMDKNGWISVVFQLVSRHVDGRIIARKDMVDKTRMVNPCVEYLE